MTDPVSSADLIAPEDDGAARHLPGTAMPPLELRSTHGRPVRLDALVLRSVVFVYPGIGGPDLKGLIEEWTAIPGARGCTPEACSFRDELADFEAERVQVFGLSSQSSSNQMRHVKELGLPYPLLSDESLALSETLGLPTFEFHGRRYFKRITLVISGGTVEVALYPVFPPEHGAAQALRWLREHPS